LLRNHRSRSRVIGGHVAPVYALFKQSDNCAPAIAAAAWINILLKFRAGIETVEIQETARRYSDQLLSALDPSKSNSIRALSDTTENDVFKLRADIAQQIGSDEVSSGEFGAGCVENHVYNEYKCNRALSRVNREIKIACGTAIRAHMKPSIAIRNEIMQDPKKFARAKRSVDIKLTRVAKWHRIRLYDKAISREFDSYSIDYVSLTGVEPAAIEKKITRQQCERSFERLDVATAGLRNTANDISRLVKHHNALILKMHAFHETITALEEAQSKLQEFVEGPSSSVPELINAYALVARPELDSQIVRDAVQEYEDFISHENIRVQQAEFSHFNAYTSQVVNNSIENVEHAFASAKRGASLRKFVSFLQIVKVFGTLIKAIDDLTPNTVDEAITSAKSGVITGPKTADELKVSRAPGSDHVIAPKTATILKGDDTAIALSKALEGVKTLGNTSDAEKIFVVDASLTTIEQLMEANPSSISNKQLAEIEETILLSTLIVSGLGPTDADEYASNNKVDG